MIIHYITVSHTKKFRNKNEKRVNFKLIKVEIFYVPSDTLSLIKDPISILKQFGSFLIHDVSPGL